MSARKPKAYVVIYTVVQDVPTAREAFIREVVRINVSNYSENDNNFNFVNNFAKLNCTQLLSTMLVDLHLEKYFCGQLLSSYQFLRYCYCYVRSISIDVVDDSTTHSFINISIVLL